MKSRMKALKIIPALPEDAQKIVEIRLQITLPIYINSEFGITAEDIKSANDDAAVKRWERRLGEKNTWHRVAKDGNDIIAFCVARKSKERNILASLYILPEYQSMGIGKLLAEQALKWLGGEKDITTDVVVYNEKAIKFYKKLGFESLEPYDWTLENGKIIPETRMIKRTTKHR